MPHFINRHPLVCMIDYVVSLCIGCLEQAMGTSREPWRGGDMTVGRLVWCLATCRMEISSFVNSLIQQSLDTSHMPDIWVSCSWGPKGRAKKEAEPAALASGVTSKTHPSEKCKVLPGILIALFGKL